MEKIGKTLDEIMAMKFPTKYKWGKWSFEKNLTLVHKDATYYGVDLERMSSIEMLDWIFHVSKKDWVTSKDLGDLVKALNDIFNVQSQLNYKSSREQYDIKYKYIERSK